jgi:hypothetical protein
MNSPDARIDCPSCGFPLRRGRDTVCPKCEAPIQGGSLLPLLKVDVVHGGETWNSAREKIEKAVSEALFSGHAGVKIVHGHGSTTGRSVIAPQAVTLMRALAERTGGTFAKDRQNPGASLIWFNR